MTVVYVLLPTSVWADLGLYGSQPVTLQWRRRLVVIEFGTQVPSRLSRQGARPNIGLGAREPGHALNDETTGVPMTLTLRLFLTIAAATLVVSACSDDNGDDTASNDPSSTSTTAESDDQTSTSGATSTSDETSSTTETTESTDSTDSTATTPDDEVVCSATGVERPGPQSELPTPVADKREAILTAALACDIDALAALTGSSFTASFGGGEPTEIWTADEEEFDNEPMRALVEILRLAPTTGPDGSGGIAYTWPPAFSYETWEEVPEADRETLRVLYDDDDFDDFAQFGGYIGYRTAVTEDGTWTAFVAGD